MDNKPAKYRIRQVGKTFTVQRRISKIVRTVFWKRNVEEWIYINEASFDSMQGAMVFVKCLETDEAWNHYPEID